MVDFGIRQGHLSPVVRLTYRRQTGDRREQKSPPRAWPPGSEEVNGPAADPSLRLGGSFPLRAVTVGAAQGRASPGRVLSSWKSRRPDWKPVLRPVSRPNSSRVSFVFE